MASPLIPKAAQKLARKQKTSTKRALDLGTHNGMQGSTADDDAQFLKHQKHMVKRGYNPERIIWILLLTNIMLLFNGDIHLPTLPYMRVDLETTEFKTQLVLIIFVIGAVFSRLVWGPLSDKYGRRKILLLICGFQSLAQLALAFAPTIDWLIFWRAIQSLGAGVITVLGTAVITDLTRGDKRAKYLALNEMTFPIAFMLAPMVGAYVFNLTYTWRAGFLFMFFVHVGAWTSFYYFIPETHRPDSDEKLIKSFKMYSKVARNYEFLLLNCISGTMIGLNMMFAIVAPFIYMEDLGVGVNEFAFFMFTPMMVNICFALLYKNVVEIFGANRLAKLGGSFLLLLVPIYLVLGSSLIAITPYTLLSVICLQSAIIPFFVPSVISRTMEIYPNIRGLASSASSSIRSICMALVMLIGSYYIDGNAVLLFKVKCVVTALIVVLFRFVHSKRFKSWANTKPHF